MAFLLAASMSPLCGELWRNRGMAMLELGRSDDLLPPDHECFMADGVEMRELSMLSNTMVLSL